MAAKRWDVLSALIREHGLRLGAEIGVRAGRNIEEVLKRCPDFRWIGVDPYDTALVYPSPKGNWRPEQFASYEKRFDAIVERNPTRVRKLKMYSDAAAQEVDDGSLDLVFIDADHSYEGCKLDIELWRPKLRPGGWLTGHDYGHPHSSGAGVKPAVDEAFPEGVRVEADRVWLVRI